MQFILKSIMALGSVAVAVGIGKWSGLVESYFDNIYPHLYDFILVALIVGFIAVAIYYYKNKDSDKKQSSHELSGKIKHMENDLIPAYRRLIGLETEEKNNKLIFMVNPLYQQRKRSRTFDEAYQNVWEMEHMPKTPLQVMTNRDSAFDHLKNKDYKEIYQYFKKAEDLVEQFNQNNSESLKPQINESIMLFKRGLINLIDRLENNHLMKGKCMSCP